MRRGARHPDRGAIALAGASIAPPEGAFYLMARLVEGEASLAFALRLLEQAKVGVAPGTAFGPEGEGFVRLCYAISPGLAREAGRIRRII